MTPSDIQFHETLAEDEDTWTIQVIYPEGAAAVPPLLCENDTLISLEASELSKEESSCVENVAPDLNNQQIRSELCAVAKTSYECPNCSKVYNARRNLTRHINSECGKKPRFACPYCNYKNYRRNEIKKHVKTKHNTCWCGNDNEDLLKEVRILLLDICSTYIFISSCLAYFLTSKT